MVEAQQDSIKKFSYSIYGELYYSYDFSKPENHEKPNFLYNYKKHNELNVNLALARGQYVSENSRANLGVMLGTYPEYNMSSEADWSKFVYEVNVGFRLSKKNNLWLDAGIMPSHIGYESAIGSDNLTLTRSLVAENSPYYETGAKLSYTSNNNKWYFSALVLNGWQKINRPDGFQKPNFGMQVQYKPKENLTINYSNYLGTDKPDSLKVFRAYHDLYVLYNPTSKVSLIAGFDLGAEYYNNHQSIWFSPTIIGAYQIAEKSKIAFRAEYYKDGDEIIIATPSGEGFGVLGFSTNYDYQISRHFLWRTEARWLHSENVFQQNFNKDNFSLTTSVNIRF